MKKWLAIVAFFLSLAGSAQTYKIQKAWAFKTASLPGMAMQDENGNTIDPAPIVTRFIYIETNYKSQPKIDAVLCDNIVFTATISVVKEARHPAGVNYTDNKPVYITPKKGNKLWRIDLQPSNDATLPFKVKTIVIKGRLGAVPFKQNLTAETRLSGPDYQ